ncbi:hypothetical protein TNIN_90091 [Trichonephila inaurata madagascariensis]|uniref:Uncharacterized protein n=1 Tax=Trichonephila inaurata madagascariensis TaxID=2747483 RepID=A0A8X6YB90_9ARAC|nr:hypothetical protein TNIN_90091 [Trichonephila inaurata madagascariensis]
MLTRYLYTGPVRILNQISIPENIFAFESAQCLIGVTAARSVVSWALLKPCQVKSAGQATSRGAEPLGTDLQVNQRSRFPDNLDKKNTVSGEYNTRQKKDRQKQKTLKGKRKTKKIKATTETYQAFSKGQGRLVDTFHFYFFSPISSTSPLCSLRKEGRTSNRELSLSYAKRDPDMMLPQGRLLLRKRCLEIMAACRQTPTDKTVAV